MFKLEAKGGKKLKINKLMKSYMHDLYPSMNSSYSMPLTTIGEFYVYGSAIIGIIASFTLICYKEPSRVYRTMKRKNTEESPIINA